MSTKSSFRLALDPPSESLAVVSRRAVREAAAYARESPRRRVVAPYHRSERDTLHRMLNAVQPDSYVRPHCHRDPPKAEAWIVLQGSVLFFTFEDTGRVTQYLRLEAGGEQFGVDLAAGVYHSFIALEPDTVIYEVKDGPYERASDKAFPAWAPEEGTSEASAFMDTLLRTYAGSPRI